MSELNDLRNEINVIDSSILDLLQKRMNISIKVGNYKRENNINVLDNNRENNVYQRLYHLNEKAEEKLDEEFIKDLWNQIMNYSKKLQINED